MKNRVITISREFGSGGRTIGKKAAEKLEEEAKTPFLSVDEVRQRGKISSNVIESMRDMGCFAGMPESAQMTLFDDILQTG